MRCSVLLVATLLTCAAAGASAHGASRLRGIIGERRGGDSRTRAVSLAVEGQALKCKKGKTLAVGALDTAQNPVCVKCGAMTQFCCDGRSCGQGMMCLANKHVVQPVCVPKPGFKPKKEKRTARGKNAKYAANSRGATATISVTKDVGCGVPGWMCCANNACQLGAVCSGSTCVPATA